MVEARFGAPLRDVRAAVVTEDFLEAGNNDSRAGVARRNRTAGAWIAALKIYFADAEAHGATFFRAEELIFPECRDSRRRGRRAVAIDFERGAKAQARFLDGHAGEKPANSLQACGGNNRWAVGDGVIRKTFGRMADADRLLKIVGKPFGSGCRVAREAKCHGWDFAVVIGNRKRDRGKVRREGGAD